MIITTSNEAAKILELNSLGKDQLHKAIINNDKISLVRIIKSLRDNDISLQGRDYLYWAAYYRRYNFVSKLIDAGCVPYISCGNEVSLLDYAIIEKNGILLREVINAMQRNKELLESDLFKDKRLLTKQFSRMTGKEKMVAVILLVNMNFSDLSFYISETSPIIAFALYHDCAYQHLLSLSIHDHVTEIIRRDLM